VIVFAPRMWRGRIAAYWAKIALAMTAGRVMAKSARKSCACHSAEVFEQDRMTLGGEVGLDRMIRIAISQAAFEAIARTLSLGSLGYEGQVDEQGQALRLATLGGRGLLDSCCIGP
jgi:hypothetical protein